MSNKTFPYEKQVIDPILKTIKKHQVFLTQHENLPQLAKLGYMYNTLWYAGRMCWGSDGLLRTNKRGYGQCEENPKYKIEMCDPKTDQIENYIYDAWGMHVDSDSEYTDTYNWDKFQDLIFNGKELTEWEKRFRKPQKTFEEWVEVLTNKEFKYSMMYSNRRAVIDHLLFTIGNGYGYKDGFIIDEASGADQDSSDYGEWENAIFIPEIQEVVNTIMSYPEVRQTLDAADNQRKVYWEERRQKDVGRHKGLYRDLYESEILDEETKIKFPTFEDFYEFLKSERSKAVTKVVEDMALEDIFDKGEEYYQYYPVCEYSEIWKFDENTHKSYINAGLEACKEILEHESEERPENVEFAKTFINKFKA